MVGVYELSLTMRWGGMDYYTTEGGVETRLFVPTRDSNRPCDMYIGNLPMESGNLNIPGLTDTNETLAMCDTPQKCGQSLSRCWQNQNAHLRPPR